MGGSRCHYNWRDNNWIRHIRRRYRAAQTQQEIQRAQAEEQRSSEQRQRRADAYQQLVDAARNVSNIGQEVYQECPNDPTQGGCNGDRKNMDEALQNFANSQGRVLVWGTQRAQETAQILRQNLYTADTIKLCPKEFAPNQFSQSLWAVCA
jgi:hypothetical protein